MAFRLVLTAAVVIGSVIETSASGARQVLDGPSDTYTVYDSGNNVVAQITSDGSITSYDNTDGLFTQLMSGQIRLGQLVAGAPDTADAGGIAPIFGAGAPQLVQSSPQNSTYNAALQLAYNAGISGATSGTTNVPRLQAFVGGAPTDVDFGLPGAMYKIDTSSGALLNPYFWQTPSYSASWAGATSFTGVSPVHTLRYRKDAEDNTWFYGAFQVNGAGASAVPFALPSGYYDSSKQSGFPVFERTSGGVYQWGFGYVSTAGNFHIDVGANFTRNNGDTFFVDAKIPLGNLP